MRPFVEPRFAHDLREISTGPRSSVNVQKQLTVNTPKDTYKQEADWIADQVLVAPVNHAVFCAPTRIQRFSGQSNGQMDAEPTSANQALASPGIVSPCFGQDFS